MRTIPINDFLIDTANQMEGFLEYASTLIRDIDRDTKAVGNDLTTIDKIFTDIFADSNTEAYSVTIQSIHRHCEMISCILDEIDDLKDRIYEYENCLPEEASNICAVMGEDKSLPNTPSISPQE